jgi:hypothetical protein
MAKLALNNIKPPVTASPSGSLFNKVSVDVRSGGRLWIWSSKSRRAEQKFDRFADQYTIISPLCSGTDVPLRRARSKD